MSITRQNLTVIIVSFKSEHVIEDCIKSIDNQIEIIIIDNSNNATLKNYLEKKYINVKCILSKENIGMGAGNNLGIKNCNNDLVFILNPDVILNKDAINEIINASKNIESFSILAPLSDNAAYPNYKLDNKSLINDNDPFEVKSVDGFAMLLNAKRLKQKKDFYFFDENFFLYLENDDLCKRIINLKEKIYVVPKSKVLHLGGKGVDEKYKDEIEFSRNWHWIWSKFYFNKKHYGFSFAVFKGLPSFFSALIKFLFYLSIFKRRKSKIYVCRILGFMNAFLGKKSSYRPKLD
ncbi:glycosyltransferase family 2 protein [Candidatus Pelagibacter communis]|uniref:glycosyltransferase family 2 protein n=1 Tax=Pelagibacter ubique TaxID=198252 RepID=UPI00094CDDB5|nr:glycosyltransferase [Candidatus Pelagibacter ubique]|tara:strand:- start:376 stop:1251 length:876 start_codon:yes stop_codon:yes gene_type:complete